MLKKPLPFVLLIACFALQGCKTTVSQNSDSTTADEISLPDRNVERQNIEFKGVSFSYNPQIFSEVKTEEIAESPLENEIDKPDNVAPRHILFTFKGFNNSESVIAVYPVEDFRRVWLPVEKNIKKKFDNDFNDLKKVIKNTKFRRDGEIPFLLYYDAHQIFTAKVTQFSYQNGQGIFFLTQINQDYAFVNNAQLSYVSQGISEDSGKYILAEFPVSVSFLPEDQYAAKFEDYSIPDMIYKDKSALKQYEEYVAKIAERLENLPQNEFEPNLDELEKIISTLKIEK